MLEESQHARDPREVPDGLLADLRFWEWAASLQARDFSAATRAGERFVDAHPGDPRVDFLRDALATTFLRGRAVLVGVSKFGAEHLQGPTNDVVEMRSTLESIGFAAEDIQVLSTHEETTRAAILQSIEALRSSLSVDDEAVFYFAGSAKLLGTSGNDSLSEAVLLPSDFNAESPETGIRSSELHNALSALRGRHILAILDTCHGGGLTDATDPRPYMLFSGTTRQQIGQEREIDGVVHGVFTAALVVALRGSFLSDAGQILDAVARRLRASGQTPILIGDPGTPLITNLAAANVSATLGYAQRSCFNGEPVEPVSAVMSQLSPTAKRALPEIMVAAGRALLDRNAYEPAALAFLEGKRNGADPVVSSFGHAAAQVHMQDYATATSMLTDACAMKVAEADLTRLHDALAKVRDGQRGHALLIGVSRETTRRSMLAAGAPEDVRAMHDALERLFGDKLEIEQLVDEQATRAAVLARFHNLLARSTDVPCLFYFSGAGDRDLQLRVYGDAQGPGRISLSELAIIAGPAPNLITVIDAGWAKGVELPWEAPNDTRGPMDATYRQVDVAGWISPVRTSIVERATPAVVGHRDIGFHDPEFAHRCATRPSQRIEAYLPKIAR